MPTTYDPPQVVSPEQTTTKLTCVGLNIRLPLDENGDPDVDARSVTFRYEDAAGREFSVTQTIPDLAAIDAAKVTQTHSNIKDFAYDDAVLVAADLPTGGTVT